MTSKREREGAIGKVEKALKDKEYEVERLSNEKRRLEDEVKHLSEKLA
jgi:chromosome segregation ATPase